ncbi:MAG: shikimate dehydrogenase [Oscillospiraceae bacterium]|jgi:shikimate dehydrogenase|nr:shikimate dehydrogenase [Oscillospiraceae bacterium]
MISGSTRLLAVIGFPVEHSRSPFIHNQFAAQSGADFAYLAFGVTPRTLPDFIAAARTMNIAGFNVTMPLKEAVLPYLDALDETSRLCGSVNTVVNRDGRLFGATTDGAGLVKSLGAREIAGRRVLLLGTGGAARSIAPALYSAGAAVVALSRRDTAMELPGAEVKPWAELNALSGESDVIINCTPLGMRGAADFADFRFLDTFAVNRPGGLLCDIVYNPVDTALMKSARSRGLDTLGGLALLVHQAAESWRMFTGAAAEGIEEMIKKLEKWEEHS